MENVEGNVEIDSVVDLEVEVSEFVDPTDPIAELRVAVLNKEVDPILAGATEAMAVGPRTDADVRQAVIPEIGQVAESFEPRRDATAVQPSVAVGAIACRGGTEQSATYPIGYPYFGPQAPASGAMLVDPRSEHWRELGPFKTPCSPRQRCERAPTSTRAGPVLTTTSAQTSETTMTTTLISMVVTCAAVGGPAYVPYVGSLPQWELTSVHPVQPAVVLQSVEARALAGPATRHAEFGNF